MLLKTQKNAPVAQVKSAPCVWLFITVSYHIHKSPGLPLLLHTKHKKSYNRQFHQRDWPTALDIFRFPLLAVHEIHRNLTGKTSVQRTIHILSCWRFFEGPLVTTLPEKTYFNVEGDARHLPCLVGGVHVYYTACGWFQTIQVLYELLFLLQGPKRTCFHRNINPTLLSSRIFPYFCDSQSFLFHND